MEYREKILALARSAPLLPSAVAKSLNVNSIMAGAMLSEMSGKGLLKISALKVGSSPLYFIPGNEAQLLNYLEGMNEKDRRTVNKLKEEKVIRDNEADPLTRVSLTKIKDFAKPLTVAYQDKQELFWKWYGLPDKEAEEIIRQKVEGVQPVTPKVETPAQQKLVEEKHVKPIEKQVEAPVKKPIEKPVKQKTAEPSGDFWDKIQSFFTQNNITLVERSIIKKKTEFDLIVEVPSPVGKLSYYCKARSKKRVTDADISAAYVQGQIKKLPVIVLIDGELTKQAQSVLSQLKGLTIKQV